MFLKTVVFFAPCHPLRGGMDLVHEQACPNCETTLVHDVKIENANKVHHLLCPGCGLDISTYPTCVTYLPAESLESLDDGEVERVTDQNTAVWNPREHAVAVNKDDSKKACGQNIMPPTPPTVVSAEKAFARQQDAITMPCCGKILRGVKVSQEGVKHLIKSPSCYAKIKNITEVMNGKHARLLEMFQCARSQVEQHKGGCSCSKTHCLKRYCECFSQGFLCNQNCLCTDCKNTPAHDTDRKDAIRRIRIGLQNRSDKKPMDHIFHFPEQTIDSEGHLVWPVGCRCSKTKCLQKYCPCYSAGVSCTENCVCVGCRNVSVGKKRR